MLAFDAYVDGLDLGCRGRAHGDDFGARWCWCSRGAALGVGVDAKIGPSARIVMHDGFVFGVAGRVRVGA